MSDNLEGDNKNDGIKDASLTCIDCGQKFNSREELLEHKSNRNKFNSQK